MKTRAAVAFQAGKPLEIVELDLEGPKAGEVLVELKATGEKPTAQQVREHNRMRRLGELVYVIDSIEGVIALLNFPES